MTTAKAEKITTLITTELNTLGAARVERHLGPAASGYLCSRESQATVNQGGHQPSEPSSPATSPAPGWEWVRHAEHGGDDEDSHGQGRFPIR
jgi:hypothetical protein